MLGSASAALPGRARQIALRCSGTLSARRRRAGACRSCSAKASASRTHGCQADGRQRQAPSSSRALPGERVDVRGQSGLSVTPLTQEDVIVFGRQLQARADALHSVGRRCQHGFPQAFVMHPLRRVGDDTQHRLPPEGGLFRLTCPSLVKAIDEWEADGAVLELDREADADPSVRAALEAANAGHTAARVELFGHDVERALESESRRSVRDMTALVMQTGVAAQSPSKPMTKCLHAQVADSLCRGSAQNPVGQRILDRLREHRGVAVDGDALCRQQCDPSVPMDRAAFWYRPAKNHGKLAERRKLKLSRRLRAIGPAPQKSP